MTVEYDIATSFLNVFLPSNQRIWMLRQSTRFQVHIRHVRNIDDNKRHVMCPVLVRQWQKKTEVLECLRASFESVAYATSSILSGQMRFQWLRVACSGFLSVTY